MVQVKNHKSAFASQNKPMVERAIKTQTEQGNYILARKKPAIVTMLAQLGQSPKLMVQFESSMMVVCLRV